MLVMLLSYWWHSGMQMLSQARDVPSGSATTSFVFFFSRSFCFAAGILTLRNLPRRYSRELAVALSQLLPHSPSFLLDLGQQELLLELVRAFLEEQQQPKTSSGAHSFRGLDQQRRPACRQFGSSLRIESTADQQNLAIIIWHSGQTPCKVS